MALQYYSVPAGSPMALGQHPRLHLTLSNLTAMRAKMASADWVSDYQAFVTWLGQSAQWDAVVKYTVTVTALGTYYHGAGNTLPVTQATITSTTAPQAGWLLLYSTTAGGYIQFAPTSLGGNSYRCTLQQQVSFPATPFEATLVKPEWGGATILLHRHAFAYQLGKEGVLRDGGGVITYAAGRTPADHGAHAIEHFMDMAQAGPPGAEDFLKNPQVDNTTDEWLSYTADAYDWLYDLMTADQRSQAATYLLTYANNALNRTVGGVITGTYGILPPFPYQVVKLFSSERFEEYNAWMAGLATYGDSLTPTQQTLCDDALDAWQLLNVSRPGDGMTNGKWLDSWNWIARASTKHTPSVGGGDSEPGGYMMYHSRKALENLNAWATASGENYFSRSLNWPATYWRYWPRMLAYYITPFYFYRTDLLGNPVKFGQYSSDTNYFAYRSSLILRLTAPMKAVDTQMAGLNRWIETRLGLKSPTSPTNPEYFIMEDRTVADIAPSSLNPTLPHLWHCPAWGTFLKSGFENYADLALFMGGPEYIPPYYHAWQTWFRPYGFQLDKYGPILFAKGEHKNNDFWRRCGMRFTDPVTPVENWGSVGGAAYDPVNIGSYTPTCAGYANATRKVWPQTRAGEVDNVYFVQVNIPYLSSVVSNYRRNYLTLMGSATDKTLSDYVVIHDRVTMAAGKETYRKRFELCCAYRPTTVNGADWHATTAGHWTKTDGDTICYDNTNGGANDPYLASFNPVANGANGRAFVKTILPASRKYELVGGTGHELEKDDGTNVALSYIDEVGAFYVGTYHTICEPTANNSQEVFLHVIQAAKSDITPSMTEVVQITAVTGSIYCVHIKDATENKVAVVSSLHEYGDTNANTSIAYTITTTAQTRHLITELSSAKTYSVTRNGATIASQESATDGVLTFTSTGGGTFAIFPDGDAPPPPPEDEPPPAPVAVAPIDGVTLTESLVNFSWTAAGDVDKYHIQIDDDQYFATPTVDDQNVLTTNYTYDLTNGPYYWRVRSHGTNGIWGPWCSGEPFGVNEESPVPATKIYLYLRA